MSNEANIQAMADHLVQLSGVIQQQNRDIQGQNNTIMEIKVISEKTNEAIEGNEPMGHTGIAKQVKDNRDSIKLLAENSKDFLQLYEKDKAAYGKRLGFFTGIGVLAGALAKWLFVKIGLFV